MGRQVSHPMMKRQRSVRMCLCADVRLHGRARYCSPWAIKPFLQKPF